MKTGSSGAACRHDSKLLASEDKHELDFEQWAGQQRVSSLLAVDGFRSQQRARPTSIRPYIASQHLRPIPPTRRPSCLPAKIDSPVSPSYPRVSLTTNDSPDVDSSLYRSVPLAPSRSVPTPMDFAHNNSKLLAGTRYVPTSTRSPHSAGADFVATAARQRARCLRRDRHEWTQHADPTRPQAACQRRQAQTSSSSPSSTMTTTASRIESAGEWAGEQRVSLCFPS